MNKTIEFETTRKDLTHLSGLLFYDNLVKRLNLEGELGRILPSLQRKSGIAPKRKFLTGMFSFMAGAECLNDQHVFNRDPFFRQLTNGSFVPVTMGNFLKSINLKQYQKLQKLSTDIAFNFHQKLIRKRNNAPFILSMDATAHEQHAQLMEGVEWDYKSRWCLSSQNAFDQFGLCYGWDLRSGATHTSVGSVEMIENIFPKVGKARPRYYLADSGYANKEVYNSLINHGVNFAICLGEKVWGNLLEKYEFKMKFKKTKLRFFESNKCSIGSCLYPVKGLKQRSFLRVVFIRAKKKKITPGEKRYYKYYAVVTNMSDREMGDEDVVRFYRKRGNVENHIKDLKNGMDFHHFPCQTMIKNRAWGIMGIYAYNFMRFSSFLLYPHSGCFLRRVRHQIVFMASELRKGSRKIKLRFSNYMFKEVKRLEKLIAEHFCSLGFNRLHRTSQGPPV